MNTLFQSEILLKKFCRLGVCGFCGQLRRIWMIQKKEGWRKIARYAIKMSEEGHKSKNPPEGGSCAQLSDLSTPEFRRQKKRSDSIHDPYCGFAVPDGGGVAAAG